MSEILEALTKTEVWVSLCLGIVVPWVLKRLWSKLEKVTKALPEFRNEAAKAMRAWLRRRVRSHLLKIKAKRFDQTAIQREMAKSYAALVIFCVSGVVLMDFVLFQRPPGIAIAFAFVPVMTAEVLWLLKSAQVDSLLKASRDIQVNSGRVKRSLELRALRHNEVIEAAAGLHDRGFQIEVDALEEGTSGSVWVWRSDLGLFYELRKCIAGYDFNYQFNKEAGKATPNLVPTSKPLPSAADQKESALVTHT